MHTTSSLNRGLFRSDVTFYKSKGNGNDRIAKVSFSDISQAVSNQSDNAIDKQQNSKIYLVASSAIIT